MVRIIQAGRLLVRIHGGLRFNQRHVHTIILSLVVQQRDRLRDVPTMKQDFCQNQAGIGEFTLALAQQLQGLRSAFSLLD